MKTNIKNNSDEKGNPQESLLNTYFTYMQKSLLVLYNGVGFPVITTEISEFRSVYAYGLEAIG
jgi:hypothetical protein